jgi:hypothetical protein
VARRTSSAIAWLVLIAASCRALAEPLSSGFAAIPMLRPATVATNRQAAIAAIGRRPPDRSGSAIPLLSYPSLTLALTAASGPLRLVGLLRFCHCCLIGGELGVGGADVGCPADRPAVGLTFGEFGLGGEALGFG